MEMHGDCVQSITTTNPFVLILFVRGNNKRGAIESRSILILAQWSEQNKDRGELSIAMIALDVIMELSQNDNVCL